MTLEEAQAYLDSKAANLDPDPRDSFRVRWAKFCVSHHKQILARCQSDAGRKVIEERFRIQCAVLMEDLLVNGES